MLQFREFYIKETFMAYRIEKDTMGEIKVPENAYWGAQTQRSIQNFKIGEEVMPYEITRAFSYLKKGSSFSKQRLRKVRCKKSRCV